ncbi:cupredoxin domain-containing protein [Geodermatophilus sp. YIM 151500]|uniref:cupredoxin domain-containing protein n=1 Tax=Geodermatophilus sp. YIM 151500 TaxID=2984531 RepID=UPI0021E3B280|nr:cupredoxin domain-containing protein [Geodermatophilus sp. YIM 151500]MCV2488347.1 cupredoxin domain-containing protein [Geodermatophilus sp. YIM 151500]
MTRPNRTRVPSRRGRAAAVVLCGALALTGCGGAEDDGGAAAPGTGTGSPPTTAETSPGSPPAAGGSEPAAAQELPVAAVDFDYELPTTELAAGQLTIELVNEGDASHNLVVERDGADVASTEVISPGATTTLTVTLEPGEYVFYCSVGNHRAMGMEVPVTVT